MCKTGGSWVIHRGGLEVALGHVWLGDPVGGIGDLHRRLLHVTQLPSLLPFSCHQHLSHRFSP